MISDLGECGDQKCGNYRLGEKSQVVRPDFLEFCVSLIKREIPESVLQDGLVYCSLGSGQLLFDWELLERFIVEGIRVRAVHLIDQDYGGAKRRDSAVRASRVFAGWFDEGERRPCEFKMFLSALDYQDWVLSTGGEAAHVLLDCDAVGARKRIDVISFRKAALKPNGICLVLSNPAKRTAIKKRPAADGGEVRLKVLEQQVYRRAEWRRLASVSCSRTRSRRRNSRSRRRRRRDEAEAKPPPRRASPPPRSASPPRRRASPPPLRSPAPRGKGDSPSRSPPPQRMDNSRGRSRSPRRRKQARRDDSWA